MLLWLAYCKMIIMLLCLFAANLDFISHLLSACITVPLVFSYAIVVMPLHKVVSKWILIIQSSGSASAHLLQVV